jgi:transcriptional regulator with XRE-family HTH domain
MQITTTSPKELGLLVRAVRRSGRVRIDDLAAFAHLSKQFVSDVEYGKPTVRVGLVFKLLAELGIPMILEIPAEAERELIALRHKQAAKRAPALEGELAADAPDKQD